jgi:hypothetical protein
MGLLGAATLADLGPRFLIRARDRPLTPSSRVPHPGHPREHEDLVLSRGMRGADADESGKVTEHGAAGSPLLHG